MGSLQESDLTKGLNCTYFTPGFCMLVVSMKHTSKHRTRNIHSTEVKLRKEKKYCNKFSHMHCMCLPTACNSICKYCTCDSEVKIINKKEETIHEQ